MSMLSNPLEETSVVGSILLSERSQSTMSTTVSLRSYPESRDSNGGRERTIRRNSIKGRVSKNSDFGNSRRERSEIATIDLS